MLKLTQSIKAIKALLSSVKLSQQALENGSLIQYDGDQIAEGEVVYLTTGEGNWSVLPDGDYKTKKGDEFTITNGTVETVKLLPVTKTDKEDKPVKQAQAKAADKDKKPKYGDVSYADPGYQEDKKARYPIDTEEHIRAAWNYIHKQKNEDQYSAEDLKKVKGAIETAWKKKIDPKGPPAEAKAEDMNADGTLVKAEEDMSAKEKKDKADKEKLAADKKVAEDKLEKEKLAKAKADKEKADKEKLAKDGKGKKVKTASDTSTDDNGPDTNADGQDVENADAPDEEGLEAAPAVATIDVNDLIEAKLQPICQQIWDLQNLVGSLKDLIALQKTAMSATVEVVEKLANTSSGTPAETESVNPFKKVDATLKDSKAYKIMTAKI